MAAPTDLPKDSRIAMARAAGHEKLLGLPRLLRREAAQPRHQLLAPRRLLAGGRERLRGGEGVLELEHLCA